MNAKGILVNATLLSLLLLFTALTSCTKAAGHERREFNSKKELAQYVIDSINKQDDKALTSILISSQDYQKNIYPYTDTGKQNQISAEDFYRIFLHDRRLAGLSRNMKEYKNSILELEGIGISKSIINCKAFIIHKRIPLFITVHQSNNTKDITDNDLLGVVIEKNGKYSLLNIFRD
jgi:hypothetical protein